MKNTMKKYIYTLIMLAGVTLPLFSQNININGTVKDAKGSPLVGVVVSSEDGESRGVTDLNGYFSANKTRNDKYFIFSLLGYKSEKAEIRGDMVVILPADISNANETIELGYTALSKTDFSGSAAAADSRQLSKTPVSTLMGSFAGNLPGLISHETYSEVGRETYDLHIRGYSDMHQNSPLVVIDGVPCYPGMAGYSMAYISPQEIQSVTVLKDAASEALYGTQGSSGVIVITTKKGISGKLKVNGNIDESIEQVTTTPTFINSAEYATLRNEAAYNDGLGKNYFFSDADITKYQEGKDPLYPNTNWRKLLMKDFVQMQRIGVNLSGGTDRVTYFSNFNMMHTDGPYKTESNPKYNPNNAWYHFNFRTNVNVKIASFLDSYLNVAGNIKKEHTPGAGFLSSIYPHLFTMPSTTYGPITPNVEGSSYPADEVIVTDKENDSPYGMINRTGYYNYTVTNIYSDFGLKLDMNFLTKGLSLSGDISYMSNMTNSLGTTKDYRRYKRDTSSSDLNFIRKGTNDDTNLSYGKGSDEFYDFLYRGKLNYDRDFGDHHINALAYSFYQRFEGSDILTHTHVISGVDIAYNYAHKYAVRYDWGYSGSDQYSRQSRWTSTPAVSGAWILSNESFMKSIQAINLAKLRISYGLTANDQNGLGRYTYEDNVRLNGGGPIGYLNYTTNENSFGNPDLKAEISHKINYGLDLVFLNLVNFSIDIFKEKVDNAVIFSTMLVPSFQGIPLGSYPKTNTGSFQNKGYEVELSAGKSLKNGLEFKVGGYLAYNKDKVTNDGEISRGSDYAYPYHDIGFSYGQVFGYLVDKSNGNGFYNFQSEINNGPKYAFGTPRVGDLKYKDLNHDGTIDEKDMAPITDGTLPNYTYGVNGYIKYKSFDLSVLFQGVGRWNAYKSGMGIGDTDYDGIYGSLARNAWTAERWNNGERITYPALSTQTTINDQPSNYWVYNLAYIRLKNVEVGYTLPSKLTKKHLGISQLRFILSGENLLTWDHMKSDDFGPEGNYQSVPVYRVYNIGIRVMF